MVLTSLVELNEGCNRTILDHAGLLLANKQIHVEATEVLYSRKIFDFTLEGHLPRPPLDSLIAPRHLGKIQHAEIVCLVDIRPDNEEFVTQLTVVFNKLARFVRKFRDHGNSFNSLTVGYRSFLSGHVSQVSRLPEMLEPMAVMDPEGRVTSVQQHKDGRVFVRMPMDFPPFAFSSPLPCVRLLDPLLALKGRVEDLQLKVDLPRGYWQVIFDGIMEGVELSHLVKKQQKLEAKFKQERSLAREEKPPSLESIVQVLERSGMDVNGEPVFGTAENDQIQQSLSPLY